VEGFYPYNGSNCNCQEPYPTIIRTRPKRTATKSGANYALTGIGVNGSGGEVPDYSVNFNTSLISSDLKTGMTLYGFTRERNFFDANNDSFSELAQLKTLH